MKKLSVILLTVILVSVVTACADADIPSNTDSVTTKTDAISTVVTEPVVTVTAFAEASTAITTQETIINEPVTETSIVTEPTTEVYESSKFHADSVSVDEMIMYYNEVVLDTEFSTGSGDASRVQKWNAPIKYMLHGEYTGEDYAVLTDFVEYLNSIEGFPGMFEVYDLYDSNLDIHFCNTGDELVDKMGGSDVYENLDGAVTFWYENNRIYDGIICYRNDIDQKTRNTVIIEEIYNGLGPVQDTDLRDDSIIYSGFNTPQQITEVDDVILRLLYHPDILCGMNADECEEVIRGIYY